MKASNMAKNLFIISDVLIPAVRVSGDMLQSYDSNIAFKYYLAGKLHVLLDKKYYNYSKTTVKYRNKFLNETSKDVERKIKSGEYILTDLN